MESMPTVRRKPVKVLHSNAVVKPFAERSRSDFAGFGSAQPAVYLAEALNLTALGYAGISNPPLATDG